MRIVRRLQKASAERDWFAVVLGYGVKSLLGLNGTMETSNMKPFSITLAAAVLGISGSAAAQSATDARCIVLATGFANHSTDANQQKIAEDSLYFYLGRVGGQPNSAQFKAALDAQAKTITDANAATLMAQCVAAVKTKVQLLQSLGTPPPRAPANPEGR